MSIFSLDYETCSECNLNDLGSFRYAEDPTTRILMYAIAKEEGEPLLWDSLDPFSDESLAADSMFREAIETSGLIYAFNAHFEIAITTHRLEKDCGITPPPLDVWRCSQAMCRRAAAPESLAKSAEFFGLGEQKDALGKSLVDFFCILGKESILQPPPGMKDPATVKQLKNGSFSAGTKPKNIRVSDPLKALAKDPTLWDWRVTLSKEIMTLHEAWEAIKRYCRQDVRVEQALHRKLAKFELTGDELASWQFDLRMNCRGVPVNVEALNNADAIVETLKEKLEARLFKNCGLGSGQRDKLLAWLTERGYAEDNLQAETVDAVLANPPEGMKPIAVEVLRMRSLLGYAALKKIPVMRDAAGTDGRVRGTVQWHAARTGRPGGRIIQPQNFKKSTIGDESHLCYRMMCENWDPSWFEDLWDSPLEAIASSIRHFIQPKQGMILDSDYVGVEARISPWLCGQQDKLQDLVDGKDPYKLMASEVIYHIPYEEVTKAQRTVGKPVELQLGFGAGDRGLQNSLLNNHKVVMTRKECKEIVESYRTRYSKYPECWHAIEDAAKEVIRNGGVVRVADNKLAFTKIRRAGIEYFVMRLPSGRKMYYPHPKVKPVFKRYDKEDMEADPWKKEKGGYWSDEISFYGKLKESSMFGRVATWGSRLFENAVQATGADLLNYGCIQAEKEGYNIFMIIHDQALVEDTGLSLEGFTEALCRKQPWAETFPLEADTNRHPYYLKD